VKQYTHIIVPNAEIELDTVLIPFAIMLTDEIESLFITNKQRPIYDDYMRYKSDSHYLRILDRVRHELRNKPRSETRGKKNGTNGNDS